MKLPNTASGLLLLALADLEKVEQDERYEVKMTVWHQPQQDHCAVCLAGAVMAMSLDMPIDQHVIKIKHLGTEDAKKTMCLNWFRQGYINQGLAHFGSKQPAPFQFPPYPVTPYHDNPEQFKMDMHHIANLLEKAGL